MKRLQKFLLLALAVLLVRYVFSVFVGYIFPIYTINKETKILSEASFLSDRKPHYQISKIWSKGQAIHFAEIAVNGYSTEELEKGSFNNRSLYPLYPMIIRIFHKLLPFVNSTDAIYIVGALLSTLFLGIALFYLDKLLDLLWLYQDQKYFVFLAMLVFPGSFFFSMVYSESLFLMLSVLFLYNLFRKKYLWAGIFLSLAISTRAVGFILAVPFFFHIFLVERYNRRFNFISKSVKYLIILVLPMLVFYYHLFEKTGDFFAAVKAQMAIHDFLFIPFGYFFDYYFKFRSLLRLEYVLNALMLIIALGFVVYLFIRLYLVLEYKTLEQNTLFVYALVYTLMLSSLSSGSTIFRYFSVCLPLFILPATLFPWQLRNKVFLGIVLVFLTFQTLFFTMFLAGIPAYVY